MDHLKNADPDVAKEAEVIDRGQFICHPRVIYERLTGTESETGSE